MAATTSDEPWSSKARRSESFLRILSVVSPIGKMLIKNHKSWLNCFWSVSAACVVSIQTLEYRMMYSSAAPTCILKCDPLLANLSIYRR